MPNTLHEKQTLLESIAAEEHRQWAHWVRYLASHGYLKKCDQGLKWLHQATTDYKDLSEKDKEKDRTFARSTLQIFREHLEQKRQYILDNEPYPDTELISELIEEIRNVCS